MLRKELRIYLCKNLCIAGEEEFGQRASGGERSELSV